MFDEALKTTWKRAEAGQPPRSRAELEGLLWPVARWSGRALWAALWTSIALLGVTAVLSSLNLRGYRGNATMLVVEGGLLALSLAFLAFSAWLIARLRRIMRADLPLVETVERRLALYDRWFGAWLVVGAMAPWMLSLAINTLIDNQDGTYQIHQPIEFAVVTAASLGVMYVALTASLAPSVRSMRAVLHDVRAQALDATAEIAEVRQRTRRVRAVLAGLLVLGVLAGLWLWWRNA
ncbi:MAG: hypothetical protein JNK02_04115 [Planctomycetes bacterium]|nr:hypothetical protein [Planctomycetota bacterium]